MSELGNSGVHLFKSNRLEIPPHIQAKYLESAKLKLGGDVGNYRAEVLFAVTGNLPNNPLTEKVLDTGEFIEDSSKHSLFVGPRGGTTSSESVQIRGIIDMVGIEEEGKVEKVIYHSYDTDVENPLEKLGDIWHDKMTQIAVVKYNQIVKMFEAGKKGELEYIDIIKKGKAYLEEYNKKNGLGMYQEYVDYIFTLFTVNYGRNPTDAELYAFAFANSEHCKHGVFNGRHIIDGQKQVGTLFGTIKNTHKNNPGKTKVAYVDDAAAFEGKEGLITFTSADGLVKFTYCKLDNTLKVETHNHPTRIYALEGSATGIGGLLRDLMAIGRGGVPNATMNVFMVSHLVNSFNRTPYGKESALDIIAEGPIGAANYGNEFGVPGITGKFVVFDQVVGGVHWGYDKPTMVAGGKGNVLPENVKPMNVPVGSKIIYIGAHNYNIGMGGGAASSDEVAGGKVSQLDFESVQRGNAIIGSKNKDFIKFQSNKGKNNPIRIIGDVGASGWTNTTQEILDKIGMGADVDFSAVPVGDESMGKKEVCSNESQEKFICVIAAEDVEQFEKDAQVFGTPVYVIGTVKEGSQYTVYDPRTEEKIIDMNINDMLGHDVELVLEDNTIIVNAGELNFEEIKLGDAIRDVISHPTVGNKDFLVTIGDRTVGGIVVQEQMVGPFQTPLSNVGVTLHGLEGIYGEVMTEATRAPLAIVDPAISCKMGIATAILKALSAYIPELDSFSGSGNWMAAKNYPGQLAALHKGVKAVEEITNILGFDISVGKDSLSMKEGDIVSPLTLVITLYADSGDVRKTLTPDLKKVENTELFLLDFGEGKNRLGGSILAQANNQFGNEIPEVENPKNIRNFMKAMIELHEKGLLLAYHKRSDGGLFSAISEMSFASHIGVDIDINSLVENDSHENRLRALFSEELGVIMQFESSKKHEILEILKKYGLDHLGHTIGKLNFEKQNIGVSYNGIKFIDEKRVDLQKAWSQTSLLVKNHRKNNNSETTRQEFDRIDDEFEPPMQNILTFDVQKHPALEIIADYERNNKAKPKLAVLSTEGTNSQEEMKRYFNRAGFEVYNVHLNDLIAGKHKLSDFRALSLAGGFGHGDALGAGVGFSKIVMLRPELREQFENFTGYILGTCNGFQDITEMSEILSGGEKFPKLLQNTSTNFEARKAQVKITENPDSIFFKGMGGSILSQINSHGEGRINGGNIKYNVNYVDNRGNTTEQYPHNPNGSPNGATGFEYGKICGMMGHPEREWQEDSPWLRLAYNIRSAVEKETA